MDFKSPNTSVHVILGPAHVTILEALGIRKAQTCAMAVDPAISDNICSYSAVVQIS